MNEDEVRVVWMPKVRQQLLPFRGEGKSVAVRPIDAKKLFKDIPSDAPELLAVRDGTIAKTGDFKAEGLTAGLFMNASRNMTGGYRTVTAKLVDRWMQVYGAAYTIEQITLLPQYGGNWAFLASPSPVFNPSWVGASAERAREWLAHAPDYDAALARAVALFSAIPEPERKDHAALFSFLFPDHKPFLSIALGAGHHVVIDKKLLVTCVTTKEEYNALFADKFSWDGSNAVSLAARFGADGFEMLKAAGGHDEDGLFYGFLPYVGVGPAQELTRYVGNKRRATLLTAYFTAHPELAKTVLPPFAAKGKKAIKESVALILAQIEKASGTTPSVTASEDALPSVLTAPPWRQKKRPALLSGTVKPAAVGVVCPPATGAKPTRWARNYKATELDVSKPPGTYRNYNNETMALDPDDSIPLFGEAALPGLIAALPAVLKNTSSFYYSGSYTTYIEQYIDIATVDLAMPFARLLERKEQRAFACRWAAKWPRHTFNGILLALFGPPSSDRDHALAMLNQLHRAEGDDGLRTLAKEVGVSAQMDAWLARDPLEDAPRAPASIPKFLDLSGLPRPELKGGKGALSDNAVRNLVEMLSFASTLTPIYAGVAQVKAALDPASLDRFALALAEGWIAAGARAANGWVADALGLVGSTDVVPWIKDRLGGLIAQKERAATLRMVQALLRIDSPSARMYVLKQVRHGQQAWLKREGAELLETHLAQTGLTMDAFEASAVPPMPETIDFGDNRPLTICLDEQLRPSLRTKDGERLKRAPSAKGEAAVDWPRIKEEAELVVKMEQARLERLTSSGDTFSVDSFTKMLAHPILRALAQGVVFVSHAEGGPRTFRVAEDGTYADQDDEAFELPKDAVLSLMHPIDVDAKTLATWAERFGDYRLIQPIEQLSREVFTLSAEEKVSRSIERFAEKQVYAGKILGLRQRGWGLEAQMEGEIEAVRRSLTTLSGEQTSAWVHIKPAIRLHDETKGEHALGSLTLGVTFAELSAKAASELCLAMAHVTLDS